MNIKTFKRYELKYFVTPQQYNILCAEFNKHMDFDSHCPNGGSYTIYNIYFDTEDNNVIRKSLAKPYYKEKLRLRSYQMPTQNNDTVFLELKKKIGGIVAKRRAILHYDQAMAFVLSGQIPPADNYQDKQVIAEIAEFLSRYKVTPKVYISYQRVAFFGKANKDFRISFDGDILTRRNKVNLYQGDYGTELLGDRCLLMEVKCAGAMPLWLTSLLSQHQIYTTSFSKYGTEYQQYLRSKLQKSA